MSVILKKVNAFKKYYLDKYNFNIYLNPLKGFFDQNDKENLIRQGIKLKLYKKLWVSNLSGFWNPQKPKYYFGYWQDE